MVRAKFYVHEIKPVIEGKPEQGASIILNPVMSGSKENESFYNYSPWGQIELGTVNVEAVKQFEVGKEYYVDFTEAGG